MYILSYIAYNIKGDYTAWQLFALCKKHFSVIMHMSGLRFA